MEILKIPCKVKVYTTSKFIEIMDNSGNRHLFPIDKVNKVDYIYTSTESA